MKKHQGVAIGFLAGFFFTVQASADAGFYVGIEGGKGHTQLSRQDDTLILSQGILLDTSSDREDTTLGLYAAYTFAKHFGVELAYADLGETSFTTVEDIEPIFILPPGLAPPTATLGTSLDVAFRPVSGGGGVRAIFFRHEQRMTFESEALSIALLGRYDFAAGLAVFGRAGIAVHRYEVSLQAWIDGQPVRVVGGPGDQSAGAGVIGLGGEWSFHPNWALRVQAQRHFALGEEAVSLVERDDVTTVTGGIQYRF